MTEDELVAKANEIAARIKASAPLVRDPDIEQFKREQFHDEWQMGFHNDD